MAIHERGMVWNRDRARLRRPHLLGVRTYTLFMPQHLLQIHSQYMAMLSGAQGVKLRQELRTNGLSASIAL